jgi:hypothetical protein
MIQASELLEKYKKPEVRIIPKKLVISYIADKVKFHSDPLTNWKIIARKLKPVTPRDATIIYEGIKLGTWDNSSDYKKAFELYCKDIKYEKKPKQHKLL